MPEAGIALNVTVYCGSSFGHDPAFREAALELGSWIARQGHTLVYGGTHVGLMGLVADAVLDGGGTAIGILPVILADREPPFERLTELHVVDTMAERKAMMIELGDVFVALPGGPGTLEELSEIMSLVKIGTMTSNLILANINGYYDELVMMFDRMCEHGWMTPQMRAHLHAPTSVAGLIESLSASGV